MSAIVEELRRMTAVEADQYSIGEKSYWADADLEALLAARVSDRLLQAPVTRISTVAEGGAVEVLNGQVGVNGTLDTQSAAVFDFDGKSVAGVTVYPDGRLEFDTDQTSKALMLTGIAYDLNGAAADVLTDWAAAVKGGYDVTVDGQSMKRSQRHSQLLAQAETFRAKAVIASVSMHRSDSRRRRGHGRRLCR